MGASNFIEFASARTPQHAFDNLVDELVEEFGDDPYNGTMSSCELSSEDPVKLADIWSPDVAKAAVRFADGADWGEKGYARTLDCGADTDNPGERVWAFFGRAVS